MANKRYPDAPPVGGRGQVDSPALREKRGGVAVPPASKMTTGSRGYNPDAKPIPKDPPEKPAPVGKPVQRSSAVATSRPDPSPPPKASPAKASPAKASPARKSGAGDDIDWIQSTQRKR